jgi:hypothetical protein
MDKDVEYSKLKWLLIAGVGFIVSGFISMTELRYAVFGKTVDAKVSEIRQKTVTGRRGSSHVEMSFDYHFPDADGKIRNEKDDVPEGWPRPADGTIPVQYIPGVEKASRLSGHSNLVAVYIFLVCTIVLGYVWFRFSKLANEPMTRYGGSKRRK